MKIRTSNYIQHRDDIRKTNKNHLVFYMFKLQIMLVGCHCDPRKGSVDVWVSRKKTVKEL